MEEERRGETGHEGEPDDAENAEAKDGDEREPQDSEKKEGDEHEPGSAEEAEAEEGGDAGPEERKQPRAVEKASSAVQGEAEVLQKGDTVRSPLGPLPKLSLLAIAAFLVVFMAVFMGLWALLGGLGLALGWIPAAAAGFLAIKLVGDRARA